MASRAYGSPVASSPELIDLSDSESIYSISEEEVTQRDMNDRRLTQAINYIAEEGGNDSPPTFINRVDRIDEALLQQLPQRGGDFNPKLYRRLRAMVLDVQREFEEAVAENLNLIEADDDDLPEYYTPSAEEHALYKEADEVESPLAKHPRLPLETRLRESEDNVQREREFKYGGPHNETENWKKDYPAILPFPETLQMAHWESLKIDYDLSESLKPGAKAVETSIPFDHPLLDEHKNLHQYDSGSRFKLPDISPSDEKRINELGTEQKLKEVVDAFNMGDRDQEITKDYAPRVFLEKFVASRHVSPTAIRRAVNVTPTKLRRASNVSITTPVSKTKRKVFDHTELPELPAKASARTPASQIRSSGSRSAASAAFRRISDSRKEALRASPRRESIPSASKQAPVKLIADRVEIPVKRGRGRPPKVLKATTPASTPAPAPAPAPVVKDTPPSTKSQGKRKRSIGSENYTPDPKRKKSIGSEEFTPSSLKKKTRSTPTKKKVDFAEPLVSSADEEEDDCPVSPVPAVVVAAKPSKKKAESKATAAGKAVRKKRAPRVTEERVTESEYERRMQKVRKGVASGGVGKRGITRSGAKFK